MESMASRARTLDSHLELIHAMSAVTAILFGISLALSLSIALWDVRSGSPRVAGEIANAAGLSSMLFGSLYTRTSRYEKVLVRQWREGHQKSRAERFRAIGFLIVGGTGLLTLILGAPILIEMIMWPSQGWFEDLSRAEPVTFVIAATFLVGALVYRSARASADD